MSAFIVSNDCMANVCGWLHQNSIYLPRLHFTQTTDAGTEVNYTLDCSVREHMLHLGRMPVQSVDVLEHGAVAYAEVLIGCGFEASAGSRLD